MVDMHHIISDGVSTGLLIKDFMAIYAGERLSSPGRHYTYKDFSQWQNSSKYGEAIKNQEEYWLSKFKNGIPLLNLPTDYTRPVIQSFEGKRTRFELKEEETGRLKQLAQEKDATLFMVLLAVYTILLSKISDQEDIVIGSPLVGRPHAELEKNNRCFC
jgi:hypothetical protein